MLFLYKTLSRNYDLILEQNWDAIDSEEVFKKQCHALALININ